MLTKVQGEQEEQSCREITAASKGSEMLGQQAMVQLAPCPALPCLLAGLEWLSAAPFGAVVTETCHTVNMELNLTPIYISRAWQWPSSLCRCSGRSVAVERAPAACPWEVLRGPGSGALSYKLRTSSSWAPSLSAGHTPELIFWLKK